MLQLWSSATTTWILLSSTFHRPFRTNSSSFEWPSSSNSKVSFLPTLGSMKSCCDGEVPAWEVCLAHAPPLLIENKALALLDQVSQWLPITLVHPCWTACPLTLLCLVKLPPSCLMGISGHAIEHALSSSRVFACSCSSVRVTDPHLDILHVGLFTEPVING